MKKSWGGKSAAKDCWTLQGSFFPQGASESQKGKHDQVGIRQGGWLAKRSSPIRKVNKNRQGRYTLNPAKTTKTAQQIGRGGKLKRGDRNQGVGNRAWGEKGINKGRGPIGEVEKLPHANPGRDRLQKENPFSSRTNPIAEQGG